MDSNFKKGSCNINWKIKNFNISLKSYKSPIFYLTNSQEAEWYLRINFYYQIFYCYLKSNSPFNGSVCYDISICSKEESTEKCGILTFRNESCMSLVCYLLKKETPFRNLHIQLRLKDMSDFTFFLHRLRFCTVVEVETRKIKYDIPHFNELQEKEEFFVRVLPVWQKSIRFEMKMWVTNDEDNIKILHIDVSDSTNTLNFHLFAKISAEDSNGKVINAATQYQEFQTKSGNVCYLKIPVTEAALKSYSASNQSLSIQCEFSTTEGKSISWVEESTTLSIQEVSSDEVSNRSIEKEKHNMREDYLCLYVEGKYTDIVLVSEGYKYPAHKAVLCARSSVFAAMFDAEKDSSLVEVVGIEPETLDQMIFFMYSEILEREEYENVLKLYKAADKYQVLTLKDKCALILKNLLDTQNAVEVLILADTHHNAELQNSVEVFICAKAKKVFPTKEWISFMKENPNLGCKVMHVFCMENL